MAISCDSRTLNNKYRTESEESETRPSGMWPLAVIHIHIITNIGQRVKKVKLCQVGCGHIGQKTDKCPGRGVTLGGLEE